MFTEENSSLLCFETVPAERLVFELFWLFEKSGRWYDNVAEQCRRLQMTEEEHNEQHKQWLATSTEKHEARHTKAIAAMGSFSWVRTGCEFELWRHTRINRNDVIIHAFMIGYGDAGCSDDPNIYIVHRPGDQDDYDKVRILQRQTDTSSIQKRRNWVNQPLTPMYLMHQRDMEASF